MVDYMRNIDDNYLNILVKEDKGYFIDSYKNLCLVDPNILFSKI